MNARSTSCGAADGFTLIELIVGIVVAAIVASFVALFLQAPVTSYFAQTRRADLVDSAERAAYAVSTDMRTALPNSVRARVAGNRRALELLATEGTARYYGTGDQNGVAAEELSVGSADNAFGTLDSFDDTRLTPYAVPYLSAGNLGKPGHNAYVDSAPTGVMTAPGDLITVDPAPPAPYVAGENAVTLSSAMDFVPDGLPTPVHSAYLVSGPVSYVCDLRAGTLTRFSNYPVRAVQSMAPGGTAALIAHDLSACTISVAQDPSYRFGEIAILELTFSSGGESFQLFLEAPTEYSR